MRLLLLFVLISSLSLGKNRTIASGEKLVFTATYNMSGILTDIAEVTMQANEVKTSKSSFLHLKTTTVTYSNWDDFFKIRDLHESNVSNYPRKFRYVNKP